ncbi:MULTISPECIES: transposase [Noviherbaspirillum]|uniref:transposase n=1 Tax=Noviherbaspirillum TaxID=1344552 RepID=UPI00298F731D|nr:transposase [Noviherbaspirillum aerium]
MREIVDKGYRGGPSILRQRLQEWRRTMPETARGRNIIIPSSRSVCAWLLGLEYRSDVEVESRRQFIDLLCKLNPHVSDSRRLAQQFIAIVRKEVPAQLDSWIRQACESGIWEPRRFAEGLKQDYAAVNAALTSSYSNGMTEGHINRLKMIKRQMYGRASLALLRIRVLHGE